MSRKWNVHRSKEIWKEELYPDNNHNAIYICDPLGTPVAMVNEYIKDEENLKVANHIVLAINNHEALEAAASKFFLTIVDAGHRCQCEGQTPESPVIVSDKSCPSCVLGDLLLQIERERLDTL